MYEYRKPDLSYLLCDTDYVSVHGNADRASGECDICRICQKRILGIIVRQCDQFHNDIAVYVSFPGKYYSEGDTFDHMRVYVCNDPILRIQDDDVCKGVLSDIFTDSGIMVSHCVGADPVRNGRQSL